jgi:serine/threonine-protein kinase
MQAGQRVGPFDIEKELGSGAMGAVYLAKYRKTGQRVAIKVMAEGLGINSTAMARFQREAEMLKQLNHPNIVRFYIAAQIQGTPYYAMEYIEGEGLDKVLERRDRFTWEETVEIGKQICAALQHAHHQGIVHRDLKPSNLMVTSGGKIKLTDFGIAKDLDETQLTATHCTVGTASYMSPEQCKGERNLSHKSDLYSLGVVLYELVTGRKPFEAENTMDMFWKHVQGEVERPSRLALDIPVWLDTLICQLLEKKPEHRPFDAALVAEALNQVAEKVSAQQSAGADAARTRIREHTAKEVPADAADVKAARDILRGRRKRRKRPIYERGWFVGAGIVALLLAISGVLYEVFRPPSAEKLYQEIKKIVDAKDYAALVKARKGPIEDYLQLYRHLQDERTTEVRKWAEEIDVRELWSWLISGKPGSEGDAGPVAREALDFEDKGKLEPSRACWQRLTDYDNKDDPDKDAWRLIAEGRLRDLGNVAPYEEMVRAQIGHARTRGQVFKPEEETPRLVAEAFRYEDLGDFAAAQRRWAELKRRYAKDRVQGVVGLLSAKQLVAVKAKSPPEEKEEKDRLELLTKALEQPNRIMCLEISDLYNKDPATGQEPTGELAALVAKAQDFLKGKERP